MTCVAWDGKTLAADKRATCSGMASTTTKIRRSARDGALLGWTGNQDAGELLAEWYEAGADKTKWPEFQKDKEDWCRLIVVNGDGAWYYETKPVAVRVEDPFMAWGSGRDFALAALHLGKTAREAVEVACIFDTGCGNGIDTLERASALAVVGVA